MIKAALIGAGGRGMFAYGPYATRFPHEVKFIAVAEPNDERRLRFAQEHGIPSEMQFSSWQELLDQPKLCEALLICTQDRYHYEPAMKALDVGYDILLEKPMSPNPKEALAMAEKAKEKNRILSICHGMRYSTYFSTLKELVDKEVVGRTISIQWNENVGYWHQAHSFVRGNWRNSNETSPMILQKCCHDIDMLYWLIGSECVKVASFGDLTYFKKENAPEGSAERCLDCQIEHECPYSAVKLYLHERNEWPANVASLDNSMEARMKALREGPYGRCVYHCDNNVVDHQVANLLFENDVTVSFAMTAFTNEVTRTFKIMGTMGEIRGATNKNEIEIIHFNGKSEKIYPEEVSGGHNGADTIIMREFIRQVENQDPSLGRTSGMESAKSHLITFAIEEARVRGENVVFADYVSGLKEEV